jgi:glycerophosphoryl diester phosphodiesterase
MSVASTLGVIMSACSPLPSGQSIYGDAGVPDQAVIAHRGASYYAPEETRPAYLLARDLGSDYLELDLQRTADGVLFAFHDDDLTRTTNIQSVYPGRAEDPIGTFTWAELQQLDAGSWFNLEQERQDRARSSFEGLRILSLEEIIDIAEEGAYRPGLYIETKRADLYPGIEAELAEVLQRRGWYGGETPTEGPDSSTPSNEDRARGARVLLQTFERDSLELLRLHLPNAPVVFLLWLGEGYMPDDSPETYSEWVEFAARLGAAGIGPDYENLLEPWAVEMIHAKGMIIHAYTVDNPEDFKVLSQRGVDGFFTNRPDLCLEHYGRRPEGTIEEILERHGY